MRIIFDPKAPTRLRVKYNGTVVYDQTLQPGHVDVDVDHPKDSGTAEAFIVEDDGSEHLIGTATYGGR